MESIRKSSSLKELVPLSFLHHATIKVNILKRREVQELKKGAREVLVFMTYKV